MKSRTLLTLLAAGILVSGCSKEGGGRLRISFSADATVVEATRALDGLTAPTADEFTLQVVKSDGAYDQSWPKVTDYPGEGHYLDPGNYTATALYGDIDDEGFGFPCFGVTKAFTIIDQTTTRVEMEARLLNMAVTIEYTDAFKGYFPTHNTVILRNSVQLADFGSDSSDIAFIKPEAFKVKVDYMRQDNGAPRTGSKEFDVTQNIAACTHLKIKLDVNDGDVGNVSITVTFNDELDTVTIPIEAGDE